MKNTLLEALHNFGKQPLKTGLLSQKDAFGAFPSAPFSFQKFRKIYFRPFFGSHNSIYTTSGPAHPVHPRKLTWNRKMNPLKRRFLLGTIIFRFHVCFRGCIFFKGDLLVSGFFPLAFSPKAPSADLRADPMNP